MLSWIASKLGGKPETETATATSAWLGRVVEGLKEPAIQAPGGTWTWPAGFADRLVDYLATGGSASVLNELDAMFRAVLTLPRRGHEPYTDFDALDPAVAMRWGRVLERGWHAHANMMQLVLPNGSRWAESVMLDACGESAGSYTWHSGKATASPVSAAAIERMLVADGLPPETVLVASFNGLASSTKWLGRGFTLIARSPDFAEAVDRHLEHVRSAFATQEVERRLHLIKLVSDMAPATLLRLGPELAEFSASSSKQVRQAVHAEVSRAPGGVIEPLKRIAVTGAPELRLNAWRRLGELARETSDAALAAFARETAAADKARSVRELAEQWAAGDSAHEGEPDVPAVTAPTIDWSPAANAVAPALLDELWRLIDIAFATEHKRRLDWHGLHGKGSPPVGTPPVPASTKAALVDYLTSSDTVPRSKATGLPANSWHHMRDAIVHVAPRFTPVSAFKLLHWFGLIEGFNWIVVTVFNTMHAATGRPTLLELGAIWSDAGQPPGALLRSYCSNYAGIAQDWPAEAVAPFMVLHADLVEQMFQSPSREYTFNPVALFEAIAVMPRPPAQLVDALFRVALGSAKTDRPHAQSALAALPGKEERIIAALADGKAEVRQVAADWLGRLRHAPAQDALEKAVAKEKNDLTKGAMLDTLQALGQPVEKYIDRAAIARDAPKQLAKGLPKDIAWFPWDALPATHWADSGEPVPVDVLRWLLVQAVKQKSPEPNAVLRKLCGLLVPRDREALGQFVLETWMAEDLRAPTPDEAQAKALQQAQQLHHWMTSSPGPYQGKTVEELAAYYLPWALKQPVGSAIGSKGLLAIAAACAGERAASPTQRYLKEWYGMRAAQGRALIAMLAWIEHPSATQLMLAVGSRFRTKSFQEEATKQAQALAERKGWTLAELADRTIPSAGIDETGTLELSFGERVFTARLQPDFKLELFNPEGKKIAALPDPRQDDDAAAAKDAKKALGSARKEVKAIVSLQADRLYEALCTERDWPAADWRDYLLQHPVMRHLVQRLVWILTTADGAVHAFRPLDDGTLTDRDDQELRLPADARVRIAHDSNLAADEARAWQQHLADYAVQPLFTQFGKGGYVLPADRQGQTALKDFEGHLLEAFSLRGRATKLGYTRGATEDGGWFFSYDKRFPTLGLQATLRFSGNGLPESNRTVALESLSFERTGASNAAVALDKVPAVLLSECRDDMRLIAAEGSGFDPDWLKKVEQ